MYRQKLQRKSKHTQFVFNIFFPNNIYLIIMWKNTVEPDRPQKTIPYGA